MKIINNSVKCDFGSIFTYDDEDVGRLLVRKPDSNKGTYGRTLIIAGSKNMGGAAGVAIIRVPQRRQAGRSTRNRLYCRL